MSRNIKYALTILIVLVSSNLSFAASLPLNTGYDYSISNTYAQTQNDNYWIRIASYPTMPVGPVWSVLSGGSPPWLTPMFIGPIPSTWVNAFGPTSQSPPNPDNNSWAIYRKCFCLQGRFSSPKIVGSVREDDFISGWLNNMANPVFLGNNNANSAPLPINYTNASAFKSGKNCLFVLVEDLGQKTGFDLAANVSTTGSTPIIPAIGPNMSFEPCSCKATDSPWPPAELNKTAEADDEKVIKEIIKVAEARRAEKLHPVKLKN